MKRQTVSFEGRKSTILNARSLFVSAALLAYCVLTFGPGSLPVEAQTGGPGRIINSTGSSQGGIIEFNTDGSNAVNLTPNTFDTGGGCAATGPYKDSHPSVSRDGRLIAFQSNRDPNSGGRQRIFVMNSDGTNVRQVTFNVSPQEFQANEVTDFNPVISPNGGRIAFISNRSVVNHPGSQGGPPFLFRPFDIFVMNSDGTQVRQVTAFQANTGGGPAGSEYVSAVWNPEGTRLAYRGNRLALGDDGQVRFHLVLGAIFADGTLDRTLAILDSTGQSRAIDWSPDGRRIGVVFGGEAQGAPSTRVIIYEVQQGSEPEITGIRELLGGQPMGVTPGIFRFSPDSQRFVVSILTDANSSTTKFVFFNIDGTGRTDLSGPGGASAHDPFWWQGGVTIPTPSRLEVIPNPVVVRNAGPSPVQLYPTLFDAQNNVIARAATGWKLDICNGGAARMGHHGQVFAPNDPAASYTDQVCASNGGVQGCATAIFNPATNKIDEPEFLVREHYADFLTRAGDQAGINFWTNEITSCGSNPGCIEVKRINVSASFFLSIEFQQTGYLVERFYKVAYGDATGASTFNGAHQLAVPIVRFDELITDTQQIGQGVVVLQPGWEQLLENNMQVFASRFVQRARFIGAFPTSMTPAQFVDRLFQNAGVTPSTSDSNAAIAEFGSAANTVDAAARARAVRRVAENATLVANEFNRAFVLMQYMGYLRRNPNDAPDSDYTGYDFWLTKLNQFNGNYINAEMVKAFLSALEYRQRFGP